MTDPILRCQGVSKYYQDGDHRVTVLTDIDFNVAAGDMVAIVGPSGSGKSTLLHLLGGLDCCSEGTVSLYDQPWQQMNEQMRCQQRNRHVGFVYQFHHLLPEFTALENVMMPLAIARMPIAEAMSAAAQALTAVGLLHRLDHRPAALSGGERQRVAIARAVVAKPQVVLADEPTGNLDRATAAHVFEAISQLNKALGMAWVIVTHDHSIAEQIPRCLSLQAEGLVEVTP